MRILLVNIWRTIGAKGGAEKVFCELSNALAERGHDVVMVCFDEKEGRPTYDLNHSVKFINAGLSPLSIFNRKFFRNLLSFSFISSRRRNKREELNAKAFKYKFDHSVNGRKFDIAISFQPQTTFYLKKVLDRDIPILTMSHNRTDVTFPANMASVVLDAVEHSAAIQVLRPEFKKEVINKLPQAKVIVIPNVVKAQSLIANLSSKKIINIGRITDQKRQLLLVQAFALLKDDFPDWSLEIWGETSIDDRYCQLVRKEIFQNGLQKQVLLCGTTDHIIEVLAQASIFAFPSKHEGWGLALTEAMSLGLPSVGCFDCSAVNSLVRHDDNGLLCVPTPEALAKSLKLLMEDQSLRKRLGSKARLDMNIYAPDIVWEQWEKALVFFSKKYKEGP